MTRRVHGSGHSGTDHWSISVEPNHPASPRRRRWSWSAYKPQQFTHIGAIPRSASGEAWTRAGAYRAARRHVRGEMRRHERWQLLRARAIAEQL